MTIESPLKPSQNPTCHPAILSVAGLPDQKGQALLWRELEKGIFLPTQNNLVGKTTYVAAFLMLEDAKEELQLANLVPCSPMERGWNFDIVRDQN